MVAEWTQARRQHGSVLPRCRFGPCAAGVGGLPPQDGYYMQGAKCYVEKRVPNHGFAPPLEENEHSILEQKFYPVKFGLGLIFLLSLPVI